jgi:U3 small nucleolar RNA-associated protein 12
MKVCYLDSLKLSLNLYGHKLPILSFDVSSDNSLLVSASADKNVKIWGLDFGDIHKSLFAHSDSITCVRFVRDTHYFMTSSKDREVKYFDGDTYEQVFVFDTFFGEVWGLACSSIGDFFVAVSADKALRLWRQTQEQVFIEEERDRREERLMLKEAEQEFQEIDTAKAAQVDPFAKDKVLKIETAAAAKKTAENLKYGEDLMEALELAEQFKQELEQYEMELEEFEKTKGKAPRPQKPRPSIMFNNRNIFEHVLLHLKAIRNSEVENTLRFLNYKQSTKLFYYLESYIRNVRLLSSSSLRFRTQK